MKIIILVHTILSPFLLYSQANNYANCWEVTEDKSIQYFDHLFANITGNDPNLTLIKIDFVKSPMIYVTGIQLLREYCKRKYNLSDSSVVNFCNEFIRNNTRVQLEDTLIFKEINSHFNKYSFFHDTALSRYRILGIKEFMLNNCEGGLIKTDIDMPLIAFLYENRIFWNNLDGRISPFALKQIEEYCKIKWDYKTKMWLDLSIK